MSSMLIRRLLVMFAVPVMERMLRKGFHRLRNRKKADTRQDTIDSIVIDE